MPPTPLQLAQTAFLNRDKLLRARRFPVETRVTEIERKTSRHAIRSDAAAFAAMMKPENADQIIDRLPAAGASLHALLSGDFVFCHLVTRLVERLGEPLSLSITTLSLSLKNLEALEKLLVRFQAFPLSLVISSYFQSTNKEIFRALESLASRHKSRIRLTIGRTHAKIVLIDYGPDDPRSCYILETSANLRSSSCLEHVSIFRDRQLHDFHAAWIRDFENSQNSP